MTSIADHQVHASTTRTPATLLQLLISGWKSRLAVKRLTRLDDRLLDDIGVSRSDIGWALGLPMAADAEAALFDQVRGRHAPTSPI